MQKRVTSLVDALVDDLSFQESYVQMPLLQEMETWMLAVVMLGSIFNLIVMIISSISVLLVYSLLMVSVENKTFSNGVLRMVGVTKADCILVVVCSTLTFVVPSLIISYSLALVANHYLLTAIYPPEMSDKVTIIPDWLATV